MDERLKKQLEFVLEIDKEKNIFRQTHLSGQGRNENDAEHAWHMAIMAYLLREYSNEPVDIGRVMLMCLIHDIVEIDAGDTYAYDAEGLKTQKAREDAAKERIFSLLPEDQKTGKDIPGTQDYYRYIPYTEEQLAERKKAASVQSTENKITALKANLQETDYVAAKIAEGAATREEYSDILEQRATWRQEINQLEEELITMGENNG